MRSELEKMSKDELVDLIVNIITGYNEEFTKLPFVYCPTCNRRLRKG